MLKRLVASAAVSLVLSSLGCGGRTGSEPFDQDCIPGAQFSCGCLGGGVGVQICNAQGNALGPCSCGFGSSGTTTGSSASSSSTGSSVTSGSGVTGVTGVTSGAGGSNGSGGSGTGGTGGDPIEDCTLSKLKYHVVDAEFSDKLDRVVLVASNPNALVVLDPTTLEAREVPLPVVPNAVSVSPDGLSAAVAHNARVSIVDLAAATLTKSISTTSDASDIVLASNGYAYVFPQTDQWVDIHSVEIATGVDHGKSDGWAVYAGMKAKLHPTSLNIYGIDPGLSPVDIFQIDISSGVAKVGKDSPYHGDFPICSDIWMSKDGQRILNGCGTVFRAAPGTKDDMTYNGALGASAANSAAHFRALVHDAVAGKVYAVPRTSSYYPSDDIGPEERQVRIYSYEYLTLVDSRPVPCLQAGPKKAWAYGRFLFASQRGGIYVMARADPKSSALEDWGLAKL